MPFDAQAPAEVTARDRMIQLRDFLETLPDERFDYGWLGSSQDAIDGECGSPACIGGWARALFRVRTDARPYIGLQEIGEDWLGLSSGQSSDLMFYPRGHVSRRRAVRVLDHYLATGKIDWSVA